jgi:hypothetical protein
MGYADGLLTTGEGIVHREKQHWWVFVWGAKFTILAVIVAILLLILGNSLESTGFVGTLKTILSWVAAAVFIGGLALLVWTTLRYINQEYVVTNRRVMETTGVVNKRAVDSSLEKINDAVLTQSIFGRALGFGDLKILTASEAAISEFKMIRHPIEFKKAMLEAKHGYEIEVSGGARPAPVAPPLREEPPAPPMEAAPVAAAAPAPGPTTTAAGDETVASAVPGAPAPAAMEPDELTRTLASLADLRDRGAISPEEYERKKADILGRL